MRSFRVVLSVEKLRPFTRIALPGASGLLGLTVATSNTGEASADIGFGRAGGSGIVHAVWLVTCVRFRGSGPAPCVQVPVIEVASVLSLPSYMPPIPATDIFTVELCRVIAAAIGWPPWSILYMTAFSPPPSVFEILITVRRSLPACNVPCHVPVMSWANKTPCANAVNTITLSINCFTGNLLAKMSRPPVLPIWALFYFVSERKNMPHGIPEHGDPCIAAGSNHPELN